MRQAKGSLVLVLLFGCNADRVGAPEGDDELTNDEICEEWCDHMLACDILGPESDSCHDDCISSFLSLQCEPGQRDYLLCVASAECDVTEVPASEGICAESFQTSCGASHGN